LVINIEAVVFTPFSLPKSTRAIYFSPLANKKKILIANGLYATKYYLSG